MTDDSMFSVQDMRLIITGAGGVIGSTIAVALARAGARLCILDFNGEKLGIAEEKIKAHGRNHVAYPCNVFDTKALESIKIGRASCRERV